VCACVVCACVCVVVVVVVVAVAAFKVQGGNSALGVVGDSVVAPRFCL
jgi:hypothetical protein